MINNVNFLLINQHHDYLLSLKEQKIRYSLNLRKKIFQQLVFHISHYALRKISVQYDLLTEKSIAIESCTNVFIITMRLSCSHKIQEKMYEEKTILMKDVHLH